MQILMPDYVEPGTQKKQWHTPELSECAGDKAALELAMAAEFTIGTLADKSKDCYNFGYELQAYKRLRKALDHFYEVNPILPE